MKLGYDFYKQIIHPDDLPLWTNILKIIPQYLNDRKDKWNEIDYFSCTLRLLRKYSFHHASYHNGISTDETYLSK